MLAICPFCALRLDEELRMDGERHFVYWKPFGKHARRDRPRLSEADAAAKAQSIVPTRLDTWYAHWTSRFECHTLPRVRVRGAV